MNEILRTILSLPEQASTFAPKVDHLHYFVISVTMVASAVIAVVAICFLFKYTRKHPEQATPRITPSVLFEVAIITVPLSLFLLWFAIGFRDYVWYAAGPPPSAMDVYVMAKQWMWKFSHAEGPNAIGLLHVPANRPVRLLMTSRDVVHSFYVPAFRIKQDVIPGRYSTTWFEATRPGRYQILCAEYCGTWHSQMWGEIVVMPPAAFVDWMVAQKAGLRERVDSGGAEPEPRGPIADIGRRLAGVQGCLKCHSLDGTPHIGPTWLDLYQRIEPLADGTVIVADEAYLTESMVAPLRRLVRGYQPVMPSYSGKLAPVDFAALVEFIKTLRGPELKPVPAKEPAYVPSRR
jgi:cytochrome c oxidase subunit 2